MGVISVVEQPTNRDGTINATIQEQDVYREWYVQVESRADNRQTILDSGYLPGLYEPHPDNIYLRSRGVKLTPLGPKAWKATASYSTAPIPIDELEKASVPNPVDRAVKFTVGTTKRQVYRMKDALGKAYLNSAKEPFPPQVRTISIPTVRFRKNVSGWTTAWFAQEDTINTSTVYVTDGYSTIGIPANKGLLQNIQLSEVMQENDYKYYTLSGEVMVKDDGWDQIIIDSGFNELNGTKISRIKVLDNPDSGTLVDCVTEQLLDGSGAPLYPDGVYNAALEPYELSFDEYLTATWTLPVFT